MDAYKGELETLDCPVKGLLTKQESRSRGFDL